MPVRLFACLALLAAASDARAGFLKYTFTTDSAAGGGSLSGSFRVDEAAILDGFLSAGDIRDYLFTFTDGSGGTAQYAFDVLAPDEIAVNPATGVPLPTGFDNFVFGAQLGGIGFVQTTLNSDALAPGSSPWTAVAQFDDGSDPICDIGAGHWQIAQEGLDPVPAPAGLTLGLVGAGCLALGRLRRG